MWMFFYYTLWSFENVERKLQNMELAGWRLTNVCLYWFKFVKARPRNVRYFLIHSIPKDFGMILCETKLKCEFNADPVCRDHYIQIYRIPNAEGNFYDLEKFRNIYLRRVCRWNMLISFLFFALSAVALFVGIVSGIAFDAKVFITGLICCASFFFLCHYFRGHIILTRKMRAQNRKP